MREIERGKLESELKEEEFRECLARACAPEEDRDLQPHAVRASLFHIAVEDLWGATACGLLLLLLRGLSLPPNHCYCEDMWPEH